MGCDFFFFLKEKLNKRSNSSEKAFKNHNTSSLKCNMKKVGLFEVNYPVSRSIDD